MRPHTMTVAPAGLTFPDFGYSFTFTQCIIVLKIVCVKVKKNHSVMLVN